MLYRPVRQQPRQSFCFCDKEAVKSEAYRYGSLDRNQFIHDGRLDMDLVLAKFVQHFHDIYGINQRYLLNKRCRKCTFVPEILIAHFLEIQ